MCRLRFAYFRRARYLLCLLLHSLGYLLDDIRLSGYLDGLLAAHRRLRLRRNFFRCLCLLDCAYGFFSVLAGFIRFVSCFRNVRCRSLLRSFAVRFASRIAFGSSGKKAAFTTLNGFTTFGSRFLCKSSRFHQPGAYGTSGEYSLFSSSPLTSQSPDENTGSGNPDRHWPGFPDNLCFLLLNLF